MISISIELEMMVLLVDSAIIELINCERCCAVVCFESFCDYLLVGSLFFVMGELFNCELLLGVPVWSIIFVVWFPPSRDRLFVFDSTFRFSATLFFVRKRGHSPSTSPEASRGSWWTRSFHSRQFGSCTFDCCSFLHSSKKCGLFSFGSGPFRGFEASTGRKM